MKTEVTRDVVGDLWVLCQSGDASAESRALVEGFLAQDDVFAATLKAGEKPPRLLPELRLSPDAERRLLDEARNRARLKWLVIGTAVGLAGITLLAALVALVWLMMAGRIGGLG